MGRRDNRFRFFVVFSIFLCQNGCIKTHESIPINPQVKTHDVTIITNNSAISGGDVSTQWGSIYKRGVCWSTGPNPSYYEGKTENGVGSGSFVSNLTLFLSSTTYYVRAYADNGSSLGYGNAIKFRTQGNPYDTVLDIDNNVYHTIKIGTQVWMIENLKTTRYRNGDPIQFVPDGDQWSNLTTGGYSNIYEDDNISFTYGHMYNGYALNDPRNIAPMGWHIPSEIEWEILINFLGGNSLAGGKLKENTLIYWRTPNTGATNETQFYALPGGGRNAASKGRYDGFNENGYYWTSSDTLNCKWIIFITYNSPGISKQYYGLKNGFSIRCIMD